jgi:hypothetical protein
MLICNPRRAEDSVARFAATFGDLGANFFEFGRDDRFETDHTSSGSLRSRSAERLGTDQPGSFNLDRAYVVRLARRRAGRLGEGFVE